MVFKKKLQKLLFKSYIYSNAYMCIAKEGEKPHWMFGPSKYMTLWLTLDNYFDISELSASRHSS